MDEGAYTRVADPRIRLTEKGKREAKECGERVREMIEKDGADDWKVYFYVSPYRRTIETLRGLGTAFERSRIAGVREEPRLREQDFGWCFCFLSLSFYLSFYSIYTCLNLVGMLCHALLFVRYKHVFFPYEIFPTVWIH